MPKPYSVDLREKVVMIYKTEPISQEKLAERMKVSLSSVKRYVGLDRSQGALSPKQGNSGRPGKIDEKGYAAIEAWIAEKPTMTLKELSIKYKQAYRVKVGQAIMSRACKFLKLRRKKLSRYAVEREREEVKEKREAYSKVTKVISSEQFVFIDEASANLMMSPLYGRGYQGARVPYAVPYNPGHRVTMIGAISQRKVEAALYGTWSGNGEIFLQFIERCVCPILRKDQIVVMDNVPFHHVDGVWQAIASRGALLMYLPPCSPDLNPIEKMWSKIKTYLRQAAAWSFAAFQNALQAAFKQISSTDLTGWFQHCGIPIYSSNI